MPAPAASNPTVAIMAIRILRTPRKLLPLASRCPSCSACRQPSLQRPYSRPKFPFRPVGCKLPARRLTVIFAAAALLGGCGGGASHSPSATPSSTAPSSSAASPPGSESSKSLLAPERFREGGKGQQTAPSVIPATGGGTTPFVLTLTARTRLGVTGDSSRLYRILLHGPAHRCNPSPQIR